MSTDAVDHPYIILAVLRIDADVQKGAIEVDITANLESGSALVSTVS